ncbi:MAG TPA: hypothetical protein ENK85_06730, partial [Saprospiraceae bacterium]|nr:hypothetical protein [Saprospiraceae bacterium]
MKKIYPILLFSLSVMALLSVYSFAVGYATHNNGGITTAPGDLDISAGVKATCAKCHTGNAFQSSTEVFVTD